MIRSAPMESRSRSIVPLLGAGEALVGLTTPPQHAQYFLTGFGSAAECPATRPAEAGREGGVTPALDPARSPHCSRLFIPGGAKPRGAGSSMTGFCSADHSVSPPRLSFPRDYNAAHDLLDGNLAAGRGDKIAII